MSTFLHNFYFQSFQGLFKGHECPTPVATEFANNQTWYVTFATEDDALKAYSYLRDEVKTFKVKKQTSFELLLLKTAGFRKNFEVLSYSSSGLHGLSLCAAYYITSVIVQHAAAFLCFSTSFSFRRISRSLPE